MGFYIRKSVRIGPIRFNLSKSGIGISSGVTGARISTGPRGTFIHMGRQGIYYRQKIDGSIPITQPILHNSSSPISNVLDGTIPTANVADLIESSKNDLVTQINSRIQQPAYAFIVGLISTLIASAIGSVIFIIPSNIFPSSNSLYSVFLLLILFVAFTIWVTGLFFAWVTNQQEKLARITTLQYNLDEETRDKFIDVQNGINELSKSAHIWRVVSQNANWDWKRNAGASSIINRKSIGAGLANPPFIQTRIKVFGLLLDSMQLFFLPDQIFIYQNRNYGAVTYRELQIHSFPTRFIESQGVPNDSKILSYTWQYIRRDGGPDRRFANNRQIPVVQYGHIELSTKSGLNLHFQVSNPTIAEQFTLMLNNYIEFYQNSHQDLLRKAT